MPTYFGPSIIFDLSLGRTPASPVHHRGDRGHSSSLCVLYTKPYRITKPTILLDCRLALIAAGARAPVEEAAQPEAS